MMLAAAAVAAAGVTFFVVVIAVMAALYAGIESKISGKKCFHSVVRIAGHTAVQLDTCRAECRLRTAADAAADQDFSVQHAQHAGQRAVAAAVGADDLGGNDLSVLNIIDLEKFGMTKMLEDHTVVVCNRDFHIDFSFFALDDSIISLSRQMSTSRNNARCMFAEYICYSSPHTAVTENEDYSLKGDEILYPSDEELPENLQYFHDFDSDTKLYVNKLWEEIIESR